MIQSPESLVSDRKERSLNQLVMRFEFWALIPIIEFWTCSACSPVYIFRVLGVLFTLSDKVYPKGGWRNSTLCALCVLPVLCVFGINSVNSTWETVCSELWTIWNPNFLEDFPTLRRLIGSKLEPPILKARKFHGTSLLTLLLALLTSTRIASQRNAKGLNLSKELFREYLIWLQRNLAIF